MATDPLLGPGLADKLDQKREQALGQAMRPFGLQAPTAPPPVPPPVIPMEHGSEEELDAASPTGLHSPGLSKMG